MGNLAYMLKQQGHEVNGSDGKLYPPMSDKLAEWGFTPLVGFRSQNVRDADLVIIGNAISRGNPEVEQVLNTGQAYMSMPEAIAHFLLKGKKPIVVAGTHGKTTTTFLVHHILKEAGLKPGLFVGGIGKDGRPGFEIGEGEYFVIEGDEYDSAFFDKSSKFLHYRPFYLLLTSLDFDHADIFADLEAIKTMFRRLVNLVPSTGKIFYWQAAEHLTEICDRFQYAPLHPYDLGQPFSIFTTKNGSLYLREDGSKIPAPLIGDHNYRNIELAMNLAREVLNQTPLQILPHLLSFPGVKRRQDILYEDKQTIVMEDFAHHPVAIQETINGIRKKYPKHKIISLFEPRSATSHRNVFQKEFSQCFTGSDYVFLTEVFNINKVAENIRLNVKQVIREMKKQAISAEYVSQPAEIPTKLKKGLLSDMPTEKLLILAMSNGAFGGIHKQLVELAKERG